MAFSPGGAGAAAIFNNALLTSGASGLANAALPTPNGLAGNVSGATIGAGVIGEIIRPSLSNSANLTSGTAINAGTISLTAGVWMINALAYKETSGVGQTTTAWNVAISPTTGVLQAGNTVKVVSNIANADDQIATKPVYVTTSAPVTYYLVVSAIFSGGSVRFNAANSDFYAVRIA